jgi:hypothetical protein
MTRRPTRGRPTEGTSCEHPGIGAKIKLLNGAFHAEPGGHLWRQICIWLRPDVAFAAGNAAVQMILEVTGAAAN